MHVALASLTAIALGCVVQGSPLVHVARDDFPEQTPLGAVGLDKEDVCGDSTFIGETTADSPLADDCREVVKSMDLLRNLGIMFRGPNKDHLDTEYETLWNYGTCTFGARLIEPNDELAIFAGGDAQDVIRDAIPKFEADGHVGAYGVMGCQLNPDDAHQLDPDGKGKVHKFEWRLLRTPPQ